MKKYLSVLLFSFILSQPFTYAVEEVVHINLQQALDIAVEKNLDLKSAKINVDIAKNKIKVANRLQNPTLGYFHNFGAAGSSEPNLVGATQLIEIGKRGARKNLAKLNRDLEFENLKYTKFNLKMDVREAYINLVAEKSVLKTLEQQTELQSQLSKIVDRKVASKKAPDIEALQAEIALNQMITQVNTAKVTVRNALVYFNKVINPESVATYDSVDKIFSEENNFEELLTPNPELEIPDFDEIRERAMENRFDIKIAKQKISVAKKNLEVVSNQKIPDLELLGGYQYLPAGSSDNGHYRNGAYVGANIVNLPIFYSFKPEIQNAKLELQQALIDYISVVNKALKDVDAAYAKFEIARTNLNYYEKKILISSDELINSSIKSYESGKTDLTSLIVMKQSYKSIIVGYTYALAEYYNSWTNFLREVNDESFDLYTENEEDV